MDRKGKLCEWDDEVECASSHTSHTTTSILRFRDLSLPIPRLHVEAGSSPCTSSHFTCNSTDSAELSLSSKVSQVAFPCETYAFDGPAEENSDVTVDWWTAWL